MFRIWALYVEDDEEENLSLFWRRQDIADLFPGILEEIIGEEDDFEDIMQQVKRYAEMGEIEKMLKYTARQANLGFDLLNVDIEGKIDGAQYQRLGKLVQGPRLVRTDKKPRKSKKAKTFKTGGIPLYVEGERVG